LALCHKGSTLGRLSNPERAILFHSSIGIFDSGVGGLAIAQQVRQLLPQYDIHYVADSGFMPYGDKSHEQVKSRCSRITSYLCEHGASAIVLACNTATMAAIDTLRAQFTLPIVGVEPGVKPALSLSKTKVVGVLATPNTVASPRFIQLCQRQGKASGRIIFQPCPELARTIEQLQLSGKKVEQLLHSYAQPLIDQGADVLVMGCTHYAFIAPVLRKLYGPHIDVLTTEQAVALQLQRCLPSQAVNPASKVGKTRFATSACPDYFHHQLRCLWPQNVSTEVISLPF
tara:strand:+ start:1084 stop:1941 length:858 start_codon:yes stop_codon:yes gene_type:complete